MLPERTGRFISTSPISDHFEHFCAGAMFLCLLLFTGGAYAQTVQLVSSDPANGATGVPTTKAVQFRFNVAMDPTATFAMFQTLPGGTVTTTASWSPDSQVMTCAPVPSFPGGRVVTWYLVGTSELGDDLLPMPVMGSFTTSASEETCTNYLSSFTIAKGAAYEQTSAGTPTPHPSIPLIFQACSDLACTNRTATNLTVTIPRTPPVTQQVPAKMVAGSYSLSVAVSDLTTLEGSYPSGIYTYHVQSPTQDLPYTVNFPSALVMPSAPHIKNYAAAQTLNPNQDFTLEWDDFVGHSTPGLIQLEIYGGVFQTPTLGTPNAMTAAQRSVVIPAGTLSPNKAYTAALAFYDYVLANNSTSVTLAYRSSFTEFSIHTTDGSVVSPPLVLTNFAVLISPFSFEVDTSPGHYLELEFNTTLSPSGWSVVYGTNTTGGKIQFTDPASSNTGARFYRLHQVF